MHSAHPLLIGSLLDPCFKSIILSKFKDDSEIKKLKQAPIELISMEAEQKTESSTTLTDSAIPAIPKKQKLTTLDKLLGPEQLSQESSTLENELEKYLAEPPFSKKDNPLSWWKANATCYNTLSSVARRLLCMPATSPSSERVFSIAESTITKLRSCLKPKNADASIFLNKNLSKLQ